MVVGWRGGSGGVREGEMRGGMDSGWGGHRGVGLGGDGGWSRTFGHSGPG
jgi:hypothetical protein